MFVCVFGQNKDTGKCFQCPHFRFYVRIPPFPDIQMCTIYDSSKRICLLLLFVFARFCLCLFQVLSALVRKDLAFLIMPSTHTGIVILCYHPAPARTRTLGRRLYLAPCSLCPFARSVSSVNHGLQCRHNCKVFRPGAVSFKDPVKGVHCRHHPLAVCVLFLDPYGPVVFFKSLDFL